ncbi:protein kinase [Dietzia maris]
MSEPQYERLELRFECLESIPGGLNEVRLWWDDQLACKRVGKRYDTSCLDDVLPEPAALEMLKHDNIVPVIAAAEINDTRLYPPPMRVVELVTPYFPRGSITDALLRGEQFIPTESIVICQAILQGLAFLHDVHNVAHRDIKSGNILLCEPYDAAKAKVCDLGLAGIFDESGLVPALNNPTLYSPPEFENGANLQRTSDLYPVGLVLIELLTGAFPYEEYSTSSIIERLGAGQHAVRDVHRAPPVWAHSTLRRFLAKALQKDPTRRFQSAREMSNSLAKVKAIDWTMSDPFTWEASYPFNPSRSIRISAPKNGDGTHTLSTQINSGKGWRRAKNTPDVTVSDLHSPAARSAFGRATDIATIG